MNDERTPPPHDDFAGDGSNDDEPGAGAPEKTPELDEGRPRGLVVAVLVLVVIGLGFGLDRLVRTPAPAPGPVIEQAWYCPDAPGGGGYDTVISISSLAPRSLDASVRLVPDAGSAPSPVRLQVPQRGRVDLAVSKHSQQPGAALVSLPAGDVAVEATVVGAKGGPSGVAAYPCARQTSAAWYFATGSTARGQVQRLFLYNPSQDDAVVNVDFQSEAGPETPRLTQGLVVPKGGRVVVDATKAVVRRAGVSSVVRTERGRVVAAQAVLPDGGGHGFGYSLGVLSAARRWYVSGGSQTGGEREALAISNQSARPTQVVIQSNPNAGAQTVPPKEFEIPARGRVSADLAGVADGALEIGSETGVVVEQQRAWQSGVGTMLAARATARRWLFAAGNAATETIEIQNPTSVQVEVSLFLLPPTGGRELGRVGKPVPVPARSRVTVVPGVAPDQAASGILVVASGPVVAGRISPLGPDSSLSEGVPL